VPSSSSSSIFSETCAKQCFCLQDPRGQATACCKLGVLYQQQGKLEQAVGYFERFFELARSLGEAFAVRHCVCMLHCSRNKHWFVLHDQTLGPGSDTASM
jgi:hypothetical protein